MSIVSVVLSVLALVLAAGSLGIGVAGLTGALRRNRWGGVRSPETLRSDETFAVANKVAAPGYLGSGVILLATGLIGLFIGSWGFLVALFGIVVAVLVISAVGGVALAAARAIPDEAGGCGCCSDSGDTAGGCSDQPASSCGAGASDSTSTADAEKAAADCGESSCGSCSLSGMCLSEDNTHNHAV
ncbi:SdpI family protein [Gordonia sp. (in: high G+C Gram-positive bacteria)]|uniref:SdpI family protein n=1 Tax=Gordonia sp. (in: high G+C Gram-positive bacteria) TaxID=84139 RepID=UPI0016A5AFF1|nr:SdpI family protein [Gordonia sp. (in: high G+C Gram-positive bacteria)]NLG47617.1 SdpI family protein [Gordonia sp. (in: high G+C Gram-positive bacteria)]